MGLMWLVSISIFHTRHRNNGGAPGTPKCAIMSFSLFIEAHFLFSSAKRRLQIIIIVLEIITHILRFGNREERHYFHLNNLYRSAMISVRICMWIYYKRAFDNAKHALLIDRLREISRWQRYKIHKNSVLNPIIQVTPNLLKWCPSAKTLYL